MDAKDKRISELESKNKLLRQRLIALERILELNISNILKIPSSDDLYKKPTPKLFCTAGQHATGDRKGQQGNKLEQIDIPDEKIIHKVFDFQSCYQSIAHIPATTIIKRQVFNIPASKILVKKHQYEIKICSFGHQTVAEFYKDVTAPVQCTICGFLSTKRKQWINLFQAIQQNICYLLIDVPGELPVKYKRINIT